MLFARPRRMTRSASSSLVESGPFSPLGMTWVRSSPRASARAHPSFKGDGATRKGAESLMLQEWHYYFSNTLRWRNLRKITIAQVQGTVYAAGLMLMWACDLIVAADNAYFADVVGSSPRDVWGRVLRTPVGVRASTGQGVAPHQRRHRRRRGPSPRHGLKDLPDRRARGAHARLRQENRASCRPSRHS